MKLPVYNVGKYGIIKDVDPYLLPAEAWTNGNNIAFVEGEVRKSLGCTSFFTPTTSDTKFMIPVTKWETGVPTQYWVYCGMDDVYATDDGTTSTKITRQSGGTDVDYTGTDLSLWTGCVCQNILYLTNGTDVPQMWTGTTLADLKWDADETWADKGTGTKGYTTKCLRTYKNFLIALQFNDDTGAGNNPQKVYWSEPAEPFSVPSTWDYSIGTNLSGQVELAQTPGDILDGATLRDVFLIYKSDAVIIMSYVGGNSIFSFRTLTEDKGILTMHCVAEFDNKHFVVGADDIYITDGNSVQSVIDGKIRKSFFDDLDGTNYIKTFVVPNRAKNEMWVCYPSTDSTKCNKALVWNWKSGAWSFKTLPDINYATIGVAFDVESGEWDDDTETWDSDTTSWGDVRSTQAVKKVFAVADNQIYLMEDSYSNNGTSYNSFLERTYLTLGTLDTWKRIKTIYPKALGDMNIYVGWSAHQVDPFTWEGPYSFDPDSDAQIRCRVTGRHHAIRFEFDGDEEHKLMGYEIEFENTGYGR
jgi:hypothetical protein